MSPFSTGSTLSSRTIHDMSSLGLRVSRSLIDEQQQHIGEFVAPPQFCPFNINANDGTCSSSSNQLYRSYDGTCNNLAYTWWGKSETPFKRILELVYDDGLNEPSKRSVMGGKNKLRKRI